MPSSRALLAAVLLAATSCASLPTAEELPEPPREFRAAWVATVANIDWPSKPGLTVDRQQQEAVAILDRLAELHMNAVVLQVRPHADALYNSSFEPWSAYLTGAQGRSPEPFYDPLEFWIEQAHARGLQLHAWFNPYRANHPSHPGAIHESSVVHEHPDWCVKLGEAKPGTEGYWWMDPAQPAVQDRCVDVILDVVLRYDIDGVHFDDYFYPYPSYNDGADFPDDASWKRYRDSGGRLARNDWRRDAVDTLIQRLDREIHAIAPHVAFGISPFGIWRPGHPKGIQGLDQYDVLFADARRWWNEGWLDYCTPQLYWPIGRVPQSFPVLLGWWHRQNGAGRHLWPGTSVSRARGEVGATEIVNQVMITRGFAPNDPGLCMFSMRALQDPKRPVAEALKKGPYAERALVPPSPWLDDVPPAAPQVRWIEDVADWGPGDDGTVLAWVVHTKTDTEWSVEVLPPGTSRREIASDVTAIAVRAVDRCGNVSEPAIPERSELPQPRIAPPSAPR